MAQILVLLSNPLLLGFEFVDKLLLFLDDYEVFIIVLGV